MDINNREYLTKNNFRIFPENNKSIPNEKNNNFKYKNKLNNGLNYIREPRVIINNEELMMKIFKIKRNVKPKLPYLSRSTNDLINYNYKKEKNKSNILNNWEASENNFLNIIPKIKNIHLKRIHLNRNLYESKNNLILKADSLINNSKKLLPKIDSRTVESKEENALESLNSIEQKKTKECTTAKKYIKIKNLLNNNILNKKENNTELSGINLTKRIFPELTKEKTQN